MQWCDKYKSQNTDFEGSCAQRILDKETLGATGLLPTMGHTSTSLFSFFSHRLLMDNGIVRLWKDFDMTDQKAFWHQLNADIPCRFKTDLGILTTGLGLPWLGLADWNGVGFNRGLKTSRIQWWIKTWWRKIVFVSLGLWWGGRQGISVLILGGHKIHWLSLMKTQLRKCQD